MHIVRLRPVDILHLTHIGYQILKFKPFSAIQMHALVVVVEYFMTAVQRSRGQMALRNCIDRSSQDAMHQCRHPCG